MGRVQGGVYGEACVAAKALHLAPGLQESSTNATYNSRFIPVRLRGDLGLAIVGA